MNSIPKKLKTLRAEKGISQKDLADILGISDRAVSKWKNGLSKSSLENIF